MTEASLRRIHTVTRHYATLRGGVTRAIWLAAVLLVGFVEVSIPFGGLAGLALGLLNIFGMSALAVLAWVRAGRWMDPRFGRVNSSNDLRLGLASALSMYVLSG